MPKEKPKKPGKPKEKIDWSDIEPIDLEGLLEEKEAGIMPADIDVDALEQEKEDFYSQQAQPEDQEDEEPEITAAPEPAAQGYQAGAQDESEWADQEDAIDISDVFDIDIEALEREKEEVYGSYRPPVNQDIEETEPVATPESKPEAATPVSAPKPKPIVQAQEVKPVEAPKPQPIIEKPKAVPKAEEKKEPLPEKPKTEPKLQPPVEKKKSEPIPKPIPELKPAPQPVIEKPKAEQPALEPKAEPTVQKPEPILQPVPKPEKKPEPAQKLEETVAKEPAAVPRPAIEAPKPEKTPEPAKQETVQAEYKQKPAAEPRYSKPAPKKDYTQKEEPASPEPADEPAVSEIKYDNLVLMRRKFQQDPRAFLEKMLQKLKQSEIHSGDKALPEFMEYLLENDPEYHKDDQYKLKGLEKTLEWR